MTSLFQFLVLLMGLCAFGQEALPMKLEPLPRIAAAPEENPTTQAKAELGRLLFFDPILSATGTVACATCHHPSFGWADGRATPLGIGAVGLGPARHAVRGDAAVLKRNVPTVLNVGFNGLTAAAARLDARLAPMFWDASAIGLEAQVLKPMRSKDEMRGNVCTEAEAMDAAAHRLDAIPEYRTRFSTLFGRVTAAHLAEAVAAFERTLVTPDSPFDRFMHGEATAMSAPQQRGMKAFERAGCTFCHGGPMLSDFKLHFIGVGVERHEFRTPSLRNLAATAPYMHDGSLRTLPEVLSFYEALMDEVSETVDGGDRSDGPALDPLLHHLRFSVEDEPDLLAFLAALDDDSYDRGIPRSVPSGLPVAGLPK